MQKKNHGIPKGLERTGEMRGDKGALSVMQELDNGLTSESFQCFDCWSVIV